MKYPVAIIDYGIGGLGLFKMINDRFPTLPVLYFSDSGEIPYGKLSKNVLRARVEKVFAYLFAKGAAKIIVACHAASSVVLPTDTNVIGLRQQTIKSVVNSKSKSVGIIGGGRTIRSGYYSRELSSAGVTTSQRIAQPLSILVERGELNTPAVHKAVEKIMRPLRSCDSILLACTHYPVLSAVILEHLPKGVKLIDPVDELFDSISKYLTDADKKYSGGVVFETTGDAKMMKLAARKAFGVSIQSVKRIRLT